jgi:hypothetical protein
MFNVMKPNDKIEKDKIQKIEITNIDNLKTK